MIKMRDKIKNGLCDVTMKFRFKVKQIPANRPLFLKVVGVNMVEIDTTKCHKQLDEAAAIKAVRHICPDAILV